MWNGVFSPNLRKSDGDHDADDGHPGKEDKERFRDHIQVIRTEKLLDGIISVTVVFKGSSDKEYTFEFDENQYDDSLDKVAELILAYWQDTPRV